MEREFVPYELAVKLKSLEFDEPCFGYYDLDGLQVNTHHWYPENKNSSFPLPHTTNNPKISAPTFSQAFRWFRAKYDYCSYVKEATKGTYRFYIEKFDEKSFYSDRIETYKEAELACLDKLIEIVETK